MVVNIKGSGAAVKLHGTAGAGTHRLHKSGGVELGNNAPFINFKVGIDICSDIRQTAVADLVAFSAGNKLYIGVAGNTDLEPDIAPDANQICHTCTC